MGFFLNKTWEKHLLHQFPTRAGEQQSRLKVSADNSSLKECKTLLFCYHFIVYISISACFVAYTLQGVLLIKNGDNSLKQIYLVWVAMWNNNLLII